MKEKNKKLVLFDFDGVIVNTLFINHEIYKEVNENLSLEEFKSFYEGNKFKARRFDGSERLEHPERLARYEFHTRTLNIENTIKEMIQNLSKDYTLSIVSSSHASSIEKIINRYSLGEYFADILGVEVEKSKVKKIQMLLDKYNVKNNETVFITDTLGDICEANLCEVRSIGVSWGYHSKDLLEKGKPVEIVDDVLSLVSAINNVLK